jgi:hypothetical protein
MWEYAISTWEDPGVVEYGVYQRSTKLGTPTWRRHLRGRRFDTVKNALFAQQGARKACLGKARYAKDKYSATGKLFVPYASAWLRGSELAFLVRSSTPNPEVVLIRANSLDQLAPQDEQSLTNILAAYFGEGAERYGARFLTHDQRIVIP